MVVGRLDWEHHRDFWWNNQAKLDEISFIGRLWVVSLLVESIEKSEMAQLSQVLFPRLARNPFFPIVATCRNHGSLYFGQNPGFGRRDIASAETPVGVNPWFPVSRLQIFPCPMSQSIDTLDRTWQLEISELNGGFHIIYLHNSTYIITYSYIHMYIYIYIYIYRLCVFLIFNLKITSTMYQWRRYEFSLIWPLDLQISEDKTSSTFVCVGPQATPGVQVRRPAVKPARRGKSCFFSWENGKAMCILWKVDEFGCFYDVLKCCHDQFVAFFLWEGVKTLREHSKCWIRNGVKTPS